MATTITLRKQLSVSAEKVFELVSTPDYMVQWFSPNPDISLSIKKYDFVVGGHYEYCYTLADGTERTLHGEFCDIRENARIVFTWVWLPPDLHADIDTLVTWDLVANDEGTEFIVTHEQITLADMRDRQLAGWEGAANRLKALIESLSQ